MLQTRHRRVWRSGEPKKEKTNLRRQRGTRVDPTRDETSSGTAKEEMRLQIKRGRRSKEKTRTLRFQWM